LIARTLALAVVATCLVAAAPALAKKAKAKAKTAQGAVAITTLPSDPSQAAPATLLDGARFSQEARRNVFQELPGGIEAGVGIYSVLGAAERTRHTARTDPMRDLLPKEKRMAAVGLKLSF
jgi:hypothetical protein